MREIYTGPERRTTRGWLLAVGVIFGLLLWSRHASAQSRNEERSRAVKSESCSDESIPLTLRGDIVLARLAINQKPMTFIVDSAGISLINSDRVALPVVKQLRTGPVTVAATDSLDWWNVVEVRTLTVGKEELHEVKVLSRSLQQLEKQLRTEVDEVLGADVLRRWDRVSLDYKHERMVLQRVYCGPADDKAGMQFQGALGFGRQ